jgi:hypothetical protein
MNHQEIYDKNRKPPDWAIKAIEAGRLKGKSDINPQWRIQALTETFGLCGFGWKYEIEKTWIETSGDESSAFAKVNLFVFLPDKWSEPIPGIGGSSFVAKEKNGLYQSDECFKMAITDALSVCCKMIGIAADIYSGSKYQKGAEQEKAKQADLENFLREISVVENREASIVVYNKFKTSLMGSPEFDAKMREIGKKYPAPKPEQK